MNRLLHLAYSKGEEPGVCRTSSSDSVLSGCNRLVESLQMHSLFVVFDGKMVIHIFLQGTDKLF